MEQGYKTVLGAGLFELVEKKSRFIGRCGCVSDEAAAAAFIAGVKQRHRDASHNVSAYLLRAGGVSRSSDDGEPGGTAGMPVLDAIAKRGLFDVVVVVTRYFGGTLLGAGGLARAYGAAAAGAIAAAGIAEVMPCVRYGFEIDYALFEQCRRLIESAGGRLEKSEFGAGVAIEAVFLKSDGPAFCAGLRELTSGRIEPRVLGETLEKYEA